MRIVDSVGCLNRAPHVDITEGKNVPVVSFSDVASFAQAPISASRFLVDSKVVCTQAGDTFSLSSLLRTVAAANLKVIRDAGVYRHEFNGREYRLKIKRVRFYGFTEEAQVAELPYVPLIANFCYDEKEKCFRYTQAEGIEYIALFPAYSESYFLVLFKRKAYLCSRRRSKERSVLYGSLPLPNIYANGSLCLGADVSTIAEAVHLLMSARNNNDLLDINKNAMLSQVKFAPCREFNNALVPIGDTDFDSIVGLPSDVECFVELACKACDFGRDVVYEMVYFSDTYIPSLQERARSHLQFADDFVFITEE